MISILSSAENCTITIIVIGDQITITWSKSDLRSDQDHDRELIIVIADQITFPITFSLYF